MFPTLFDHEWRVFGNGHPHPLSRHSWTRRQAGRGGWPTPWCSPWLCRISSCRMCSSCRRSHYCRAHHGGHPVCCTGKSHRHSSSRDGSRPCWMEQLFPKRRWPVQSAAACGWPELFLSGKKSSGVAFFMNLISIPNHHFAPKPSSTRIEETAA